jgi:hypothetical protein
MSRRCNQQSAIPNQQLSGMKKSGRLLIID